MATDRNSITLPITSYVKDVRRNRENRGWDAYIIIGGQEQYLGSREGKWGAENLCDAYVYGQLQRQPLAAACEVA